MSGTADNTDIQDMMNCLANEFFVLIRSLNNGMKPSMSKDDEDSLTMS